MNITRYWMILLLNIVWIITACVAKDIHTDDISEESKPVSLPLSRTVKDFNSPFTIDPRQPFLIIFGRGSGLEGFNTVEINERGIVVLHRQRFKERDDVRYSFWETGTRQLSFKELKVMIDSIDSFQLTALHKEYHADVYDGTQWVLWIEQKLHKKLVYCNNHFPKNIYDFSDFLDNFLPEHGLEEVTWINVSEEDHRKHMERISNLTLNPY